MADSFIDYRFGHAMEVIKKRAKSTNDEVVVGLISSLHTHSVDMTAQIKQ